MNKFYFEELWKLSSLSGTYTFHEYFCFDVCICTVFCSVLEGCTVFHRLDAVACIWVFDVSLRNFHTILMKMRKNTQIQAAAYTRWKTVVKLLLTLSLLSFSEGWYRIKISQQCNCFRV